MPQDLTPHVAYLDEQRGMLRRANEALKKRLAHSYRAVKEHGYKQTALNVGETALGAAIAGVMSGHAKGEEGAHIFGIPASLLIGGLLLAGGVAEVAGRDHSEHFVRVGTGFVAEFAANWGYGVGQQWKDSGSLFSSLGGHHGHHALPAGGTHTSGELSPRQMADIVASVRSAP